MNLAKYSLVLCTHNPRQGYLKRVIEACLGQIDSPTNPELIIVDSASDIPLSTSVLDVNAKIVRSEVSGLALARVLGIKQCGGDPIVFVDDDTVLSPNYVAEAQRVLAERPYLGAIGGQLIPEFESAPKLDPEYYRSCLAIREFQTAHWSNRWDDFATSPIGGGMVVRRRVAEAWADRTRSCSWRMGLGRNGQQLCGGEDFDLLHMACQMGYGKGVFPELMLTHLMPAHRLTADFLVRIFEGNCRSNSYLAAMLNPTFTLPPSRLLHRIKILVEACAMRPLDRRLHIARERGRRAGWLQAVQERGNEF
jgi:glycosyltransferase involved in cell wall biosynthesis